MIKIAPSLLSADFLNLGRDVEWTCKYADILHLDIMDGVFVPNISYGFPVVEAIGKIATKPMDAHLMIVHPETYVSRFAKAGASMLSFHLNAAENPSQLVDMIHAEGMKAGIAINPDIPVEDLYPYLDDVDYVLIMSVFAGFGGQKFIEETYDRIRAVKAEIDRRNCNCFIEVDGGVSGANASMLVQAGATMLVAGSAVYKADDPASVIKAMRGE